MKLELSVVIPCYGRIELTKKLLNSLALSDDDFEVVIVDDASPQPIAKLTLEFQDRLDIKYVRQSHTRGPAAARNLGLHESRYDLIAFTDNDCVVSPDWARELAVYLRDAPKRVAAVGGRVLAATSDVYSRYFTYHKILDPYFSQGRYLYVVTANCAFRKSSLLEVGGFDEVLKAPGGEDPGLCFKLLEAGYQLHYRQEAVVYHHYRLGLVDFAKTFFRYGRGCRMQTDKFAKTIGNESSDGVVFGFGGMLAT